MLSLRLACAGLAVCLVLPDALSAQVRASEPAMVEQTVDGTKITLEYFRPRVRGRDSLFEQVIFEEQIWTPGANWATTLELNKRIQLNGVTIEAGKYSMWFAFHGERWTLILDNQARRFHMNRPDSTKAAVRFDVTPETGPFTEVLTWGFPEIRVNGGKLRMNFATRQVTFDFRVEPSYVLTMPQADSRPYLGQWRMEWASAPGDTTGEPPSRFTAAWHDGSLWGHWVVPPFPEWKEFILIPIQPTWFIIADMRDGEVYDVMKNMVLEFDLAGGKATGFTIRGDGDAVWGTGKREK